MHVYLNEETMATISQIVFILLLDFYKQINATFNYMFVRNVIFKFQSLF